jgi:hypothetical protein
VKENDMMRRTLSVLVSLSWLVSGCTSWKTQEVAPATYIQSNRPEKIRITLQDSTRLVVQGPAVVGDSIVGTVEHVSARHAVAVSDVLSYEARRPSTSKTVGLVAGVAAGTFLFFGTLVAIGLATGGYN